MASSSFHRPPHHAERRGRRDRRLWDGFFFRLRGETRFGADATGFGTGTILAPAINAALPVANEQLTALTELFFAQKVGDRLLLQAGKLTTLDGDPLAFAAGRGKRQFFNTSFVFNPVFARTVPYATLGSGFVYLSREMEPLLAFSVLDSDPAPRTSGFRDLYDDVTLSGSIRIPVRPFGLKGHQAFTGTWSNKAFVGLEADPRVPIEDLPILPFREESWALGYSFDQHLRQASDGTDRGWGLFGRAGISDGDPNPIYWFWSLGLGGKGPISTRAEDTWGVGFFNSGGKDGTLIAEALRLNDAYGVELFYNIAVTNWARLTPDLQILQGALPGVDTAILFGLRLQTVY